MLDMTLREKMKNEGKTDAELQEHFEKAARDVHGYIYGGAGTPIRDFKFDAMSFRAWVNALTKAKTGLDVVGSLYIGTVQNVGKKGKERKKIEQFGKIAARIIADKRQEGVRFGLRTDVTTSINYYSDANYNGLRRRLVNKNYPDLDAKVKVHQFFSPWPDYLFHIVEIPQGERVVIRVVESEIVDVEDKPEWAVNAVRGVIHQFTLNEIVPHHPQYVEHAVVGLNFDIELVKKPNGAVQMLDATALINKKIEV